MYLFLCLTLRGWYAVLGTMVPFTLRILAAELVHHMGDNSSCIDRLYALLQASRNALQSIREVRCVIRSFSSYFFWLAGAVAS